MHTIIVRIEGEPFLSGAVAYREAHIACAGGWADFAHGRKAARFMPGVMGLWFGRNDTPPEGWIAGSGGFAKPGDGHPDAALMAGLPKPPSGREVFGTSLVCDLAYESPDGSRGFGLIGNLFEGPSIGWSAGPDPVFVAIVPDARRAAEEHLARRPGDRIANGAESWTLPAGLARISGAERDLIFAEARVRAERASAGAA